MALNLLGKSDVTIAQWFQAQPKSLIRAEVLAIVALVGLADYATGHEVSLFVFYAIPILLAVWFVDRTWAVFTAVLSALVWWWVNVKVGHAYFITWKDFWETVVRLAFFLFVEIGGGAMKEQRDLVAARLAAVTRLREMEREIVAASEREQMRIGQDLHDGVCQCLAAITFAAHSLKTDLEARFLPEATDAADIETMLKDAITQTRNVSRGIAPVHIDDAGLKSALHELAASTARFAGVHCVLQCHHEPEPPSPEVATHLFRIAQEAVNNALKHAVATEITITLDAAGQGLDLTIRDDGVGLPEQGPQSTGMGMKTMQYRARLIGAELHLSSKPGSGTTVSCAFRRHAPVLHV